MKFENRFFTRRNLVSSVVGKAGLIAAAGIVPTAWSNDDVATQDDPDADVLLGRADGSIPYIAITDDGPLYPPGGIEWRSDLTSVGTGRPSGQILYLFGQIFDRRGYPLANTTVEIWQSDENGNYRHPRGWNLDQLDPNFGYFGKVETDANGFYLFKTIRPRWYDALAILRAAHIHLKMRHPEHGVLTTQAYFDNELHRKVAPKDPVFMGYQKRVRDRIVLPEESPQTYRTLDIDFEKGAICCKLDMAFLL